MLDLQTSWSPVVLMGSSLWVHHKGRGQLWGLANHWPATSLHQIGASLWSFLDPSIHCPNGPLSFLDPPPWCLTVVRNGEMREKRRNLKRPATSFTWSEMMSKLKKKATAVPSRGWSDARQKLGLALEIVPCGLVDWGKLRFDSKPALTQSQGHDLAVCLLYLKVCWFHLWSSWFLKSFSFA